MNTWQSNLKEFFSKHPNIKKAVVIILTPMWFACYIADSISEGFIEMKKEYVKTFIEIWKN